MAAASWSALVVGAPGDGVAPALLLTVGGDAEVRGGGGNARWQRRDTAPLDAAASPLLSLVPV